MVTEGVNSFDEMKPQSRQFNSRKLGDPRFTGEDERRRQQCAGRDQLARLD